MISLIVAMAENGVIGRDNQLPWRLPRDLQWFKTCTWGKPVIMGRKTFDSIGRALPGRQNIVVSRQHDLQLPGAEVASSLLGAIELAGSVPEVVVIGGAEMYRQALPMAQRVYLTRVHAAVEGDAHFPELEPSQWREVSCEPHSSDDRHAFAYSFVMMQRV